MIPRSIFNSDHEQFRDSFGKFLDSEVVPHHEQWERDGMSSREIWYKAAEHGFLCPSVPEEFGGLELDFRYNMIMAEESCKRMVTALGFGLHNDIVVPYIIKNGNEEQKRKYLPGCLSGEIVTAIAMTEPGAGSDLQGVKTTAVPKGDSYIINGSKTFISNGQLADLFIVVCKTDPSAGAKGISLCLVDANTPGFKRGKNLEKIGLKGQDTSEIFFQDVVIPKENILGGLNQGFYCLMKELAQERLSIAVSSTAACETILEKTVAYVKEREAFGKSIAHFQNTQFKLAELDAEISCMRVFVDRCVELIIERKLDSVTASKAKLMATELEGKVVDQCLQLFGGYGYMLEYPIARAYANARITRIFGGTSEVMKLIISRELLG